MRVPSLWGSAPFPQGTVVGCQQRAQGPGGLLGDMRGTLTGFKYSFNRALPHPGRGCRASPLGQVSHLSHPVPTTAPWGLPLWDPQPVWHPQL